MYAIWHAVVLRLPSSATRTLTILEHNMLQYVQYQTILVILLQYVTICLKLYHIYQVLYNIVFGKITG